MFGIGKSKPVKVDSAGDFSQALDAAIAAALSSGVSIRYVASQLENRSEGLRENWVMTAPLDSAW
jgi:hypothetical protein